MATASSTAFNVNKLLCHLGMTFVQRRSTNLVLLFLRLIFLQLERLDCATGFFKRHCNGNLRLPCKLSRTKLKNYNFLTSGWRWLARLTDSLSEI